MAATVFLDELAPFDRGMTPDTGSKFLRACDTRFPAQRDRANQGGSI